MAANTPNVVKNKFEQSFVYSKDIDLQRNICSYLTVLKHIAYTKLLQDSVTVEDRSILTGELRVIQKLYDVLSATSGLSVEFPE